MGIDFAFIPGFTCYISPQMDPFEYKTTKLSVTVGNPVDPDVPIVASIRSTGGGLAFQTLLTGAPILIDNWSGDLETISIANSNDNTLRVESAAAVALENNVRTNLQMLTYCETATLGYSSAAEGLTGSDYVSFIMKNFFRSSACTKCTAAVTLSSPGPGTPTGGPSDGAYGTGTSYTGGYQAKNFVPGCATLMAGSNVYDFLAPFNGTAFNNQPDTDLRCATNRNFYNSLFAGAAINANAPASCGFGPAVRGPGGVDYGALFGGGERAQSTRGANVTETGPTTPTPFDG